MALKEYRFNGSTYQFDDDAVPVGAVLVEDEIDVGLAELEAKAAERLAVEEAERKQREADEATARDAEAKAAHELEAKNAEAAKKQAVPPANKARTSDTK